MGTKFIVDEEDPEEDDSDVYTPILKVPVARTSSILRTDERFEDLYRVVDFLGRGKFGEVKLCVEKTTSREFAVKVLAIVSSDDRCSVEHEAAIMRRLRHRRIVQLYDAFESKRHMYLVLEVIYGGELFERVISDDFILTEKSCICFLRQICEGLAYVHSQCIIHLDIKPENVLCLTKTGNRIKIIDFGLAREFDPTQETRVMYGTPEFMAPEVAQFEPIDFSTDMWSVGVLCYVILSGLSPFMGDSDAMTMSNVVRGSYNLECGEFETVSSDAKDFISKLLTIDKSKRMNAAQCLNHRWLKISTSRVKSSLTLTSSKERLKSFVYRRRWQKAIHVLIALRRFSSKFRMLGRSPDSSESLCHFSNTRSHPDLQAASDSSNSSSSANFQQISAISNKVSNSNCHQNGQLCTSTASVSTSVAAGNSVLTATAAMGGTTPAATASSTTNHKAVCHRGTKVKILCSNTDNDSFKTCARSPNSSDETCFSTCEVRKSRRDRCTPTPSGNPFSNWSIKSPPVNITKDVIISCALIPLPEVQVAAKEPDKNSAIKSTANGVQPLTTSPSTGPVGVFELPTTPDDVVVTKTGNPAQMSTFDSKKPPLVSSNRRNPPRVCKQTGDSANNITNGVGSAVAVEPGLSTAGCGDSLASEKSFAAGQSLATLRCGQPPASAIKNGPSLASTKSGQSLPSAGCDQSLASGQSLASRTLSYKGNLRRKSTLVRERMKIFSR